MKVPWSLTTLILAFAIAASAEKRDVDFNAADGFALKGTLYSTDKPAPGVLLLHQCNANRQIYDHLAVMLNTAGYNVLTFDSGASVGSQAGGYKNLQRNSRRSWQATLIQP